MNTTLLVFLTEAETLYLSEKMVVEYTFKNSLSEKAHTIILNQLNLTIQSSGKEDTISYDSITAVKLSKNYRSNFRMKICSANHTPLVITNKYYLTTGEFEDRSKQYTTFVRILHFHLKDKSRSVFISGNSFKTLLFWSLLSAFVSFLASFVSEFVGMSLINPFVQALTLTCFLVAMIFVMNRGKIPKAYSPENIPLQFLP